MNKLLVGGMIILLSSGMCLAEDGKLFVNGFGGDQCGQYSVAYHTYGMSGAAPYLSWVQGYATSAGEMISKRNARPVDALGGLPLETMAVWLNNWCLKNPTKPFFLAGKALIQSSTSVLK